MKRAAIEQLEAMRRSAEQLAHQRNSRMINSTQIWAALQELSPAV